MLKENIPKGLAVLTIEKWSLILIKDSTKWPIWNDFGIEQHYPMMRNTYRVSTWDFSRAYVLICKNSTSDFNSF